MPIFFRKIGLLLACHTNMIVASSFRTIFADHKSLHTNHEHAP
jgi:hypothetical protein